MQKKISTGIDGFDSILYGGYPKGCPTLLKGGPGCGKTIFCLSFAAKQLQNQKKVVFITCEESPNALITNMNSFALGGSKHFQSKKLKILDFRPNTTDEIIGDFELSVILFRIEKSIEGIEEPIIIIDSLQNLLLGLKMDDPRKTLIRLLSWAREKNITLLATMSDKISVDMDNIFEEYASDCVVHLSQNMYENRMMRALRVIKLRGSNHGTYIYPFAFSKKGISIFPITNVTLSRKRIERYQTTGIKKLDQMLGGKGYLKGTILLFSGTSGTAKTLFASQLATAASTDKNKALFFSLEELDYNLVRNAKSAGIDLATPIGKKQLVIRTKRAFELGIEEHLINILNTIEEVNPNVLILDPISALLDLGSKTEVKSLISRLISHINAKNISVIMTELLKSRTKDTSMIGISSIVDTWIRLDLRESDGEFNRTLHLVKSRGSKTSNQIKEFKISRNGISIEEPYLGDDGIVFGSKKIEKMELDEEESNRTLHQIEKIDSRIKSLNKEQLINKDSKIIENELEKNELLYQKFYLEQMYNSAIRRQKLNKRLRD